MFSAARWSWTCPTCRCRVARFENASSEALRCGYARVCLDVREMSAPEAEGAGPPSEPPAYDQSGPAMRPLDPVHSLPDRQQPDVQTSGRLAGRAWPSTSTHAHQNPLVRSGDADTEEELLVELYQRIEELEREMNNSREVFQTLAARQHDGPTGHSMGSHLHGIWNSSPQAHHISMVAGPSGVPANVPPARTGDWVLAQAANAYFTSMRYAE